MLSAGSIKNQVPFRTSALRVLGSLAVLVLLSGCRTGSMTEMYGKTFYLDGAGNWGDGAIGVTNGMFAAGYQGDVEEYPWTTSFNPLVDQLNITAARLRSEQFAGKLRQYRRQYPDAPLNVVALSAGTGVAAWAIEKLDQDCRIDNFVMLGSSLSHDYDMSNALKNMNGNIYVYHSPHDVVLEAVKTIGTIDGRRGVDSVGYVGLDVPEGWENRITNTGWSRDWLKYGWTGAHQDCVNAHFVRFEIAPQLMHESTSDRPAVVEVEHGG